MTKELILFLFCADVDGHGTLGYQLCWVSGLVFGKAVQYLPLSVFIGCSTLTVERAGGNHFVIYLPGQWTYDPAGVSSSSCGHYCLDEAGARTLSRVLAAELAALRQGCDEDQLAEV